MEDLSMNRRQLSIKHCAVAYLLNQELGYTQAAIASLMGVSQSTISNMIKEFAYQQRIKNLENELEEARNIIEAQNLLPQNETYFIES
jgi:predicted transcriptional regulator